MEAKSLWATCIFVALSLWAISSWMGSTQFLRNAFSHNLRHEHFVFTPKFAASHDDKVLNVHVVPHTHDDVGWLKTVEQYFYGFNSTIQRAHVQAILDSTISALRQNPNRTFTYVEQKFFSMWWNQQSVEVKGAVRQLVSDGQFAFVNGGWCMHDEATTHFMGMIDQTTLGHAFLQKELGVVPTVGWQLDPFGHSSSQASYMTSLMGFDALYFGRIDYQDLKLRQDTQECEGLWDASPNVGEPVFWGLTGSYGGNYGPPRGYCFDSLCDDELLVGLNEEQLLTKITTLVNDLKVQSDMTKGNHIMLTMGEDFNYENAEVYMKNNDLMIHSVFKFQQSRQIDVASIFGNKYDSINIFYSNPNYYTKEKYLETQRMMSNNDNTSSQWSTKNDDFFPYADFENAYWTGYFVSRTGFKRLERVASSFLMAARQVESYQARNDSVGECNCTDPLYDLEDALGVAQHHDAISGTAKQHVANDYSRRVSAGIMKSAAYVAKTIKQLLLEDGASDLYLQDFGFCPLLNETICEISENASRNGNDLYIVVYNALASVRSAVVGIPVSSPGVYTIQRVDKLYALANVSFAAVERDKQFVVYFETGFLPQTGAAAFLLTVPQEDIRHNIAVERTLDTEYPTLSNELIKVEFAADMSYQVTNLIDGSTVDVTQRWGYYTSFDNMLDNPGKQNSGAYVFRPSEPDQMLTVIGAVRTEEQKISDLIDEVYIEYEVPWIKEVMRLYKGSPYLEVEYTVGPIPIDDYRGKEIVSQYLTGIKSDGVFYTDSNGREFQKRVRSNRPTWNLTEHEPIAGNFYPVNTAIYIEDDVKSLGVVTDRSQGGSSLKDGCIEIMVQRRTLVDDMRGVNEPLNETDGDVTPYPPYGDATRYGDGVVIRGKHRILVGTGNAGASITRALMDQAFSEPVVFVGSAEHGSQVPFRADSFNLIKAALPANVMLITYKYLPYEPKRSYLIRFGHQYAANENAELSKPVSIDLEAVIGCKIVKCEEKTLSGNRDLESWESAKFNWTGRASPVRSQVMCSDGSCTIELKPMQIRTFKIQVE